MAPKNTCQSGKTARAFGDTPMKNSPAQSTIQNCAALPLFLWILWLLSSGLEFSIHHLLGISISRYFSRAAPHDSGICETGENPAILRTGRNAHGRVIRPSAYAGSASSRRKQTSPVPPLLSLQPPAMLFVIIQDVSRKPKVLKIRSKAVDIQRESATIFLYCNDDRAILRQILSPYRYA